MLLSAVEKHGKAKKSSKKDATIAKQLSRLKVQREVVLSNCLYLSDSCVSNFVRRNLHIKLAFTQESIHL